jgi:hypothetical protein
MLELKEPSVDGVAMERGGGDVLYPSLVPHLHLAMMTPAAEHRAQPRRIPILLRLRGIFLGKAK